MTLASSLGDLLLWAAGGLATAAAPVLAVVKRNRDRSVENARRLEGDDDPDGYEGLMKIVRDTRDTVEQLETRMEAEHREVMAAIDDLDDE